jgi:hypothetical protein
MKKAEPLQLTILIIALLLCYNALDIIPFFFWALYNWFARGLTMGGEFSSVSLNFLYLIFYITTAVLLIKKSAILSQKISGVASFSQSSNFTVKRNDVVYAALIILGCYILSTRLPKLLVKIYTLIRSSNEPFGNEGPNYVLPTDTIGENALASIAGFVLVVYAKILTTYITKHIKEDDTDTDIDSIGISQNEKAD